MAGMVLRYGNSIKLIQCSGQVLVKMLLGLTQSLVYKPFAYAAGSRFATRIAYAASGWGPAPNTPAKGCALSNPDSMPSCAQRLARMPTGGDGPAAEDRDLGMKKARLRADESDS